MRFLERLHLYDHHTGLVYMHNRHYHPRLGHFTTPDYRAPDIYDPTTYTEPYVYAAGNPVMFWDPDGLKEFLFTGPDGNEEILDIDHSIINDLKRGFNTEILGPEGEVIAIPGFLRGKGNDEKIQYKRLKYGLIFIGIAFLGNEYQYLDQSGSTIKSLLFGDDFAKVINIEVESSDLVILGINGIMNTEEAAYNSALETSKVFNSTVRWVYNPSGGILSDGTQVAFFDKLFGGMDSSTSQLWYEIISQRHNENIVVFAHSQGAAKAGVAISNLPDEIKSKVSLHSFGGALDFLPKGIDHLYIHDNIPDFVPALWGTRFIGDHFDNVTLYQYYTTVGNRHSYVDVYKSGRIVQELYPGMPTGFPIHEIFIAGQEYKKRRAEYIKRVLEDDAYRE